MLLQRWYHINLIKWQRYDSSLELPVSWMLCFLHNKLHSEWTPPSSAGINLVLSHHIFGITQEGQGYADFVLECTLVFMDVTKLLKNGTLYIVIEICTVKNPLLLTAMDSACNTYSTNPSKANMTYDNFSMLANLRVKKLSDTLIKISTQPVLKRIKHCRPQLS